MTPKLARYALLAVASLALGGCGSRHGEAAATGAGHAAKPGAGEAEEKILNVYNWSDYIEPDAVPRLREGVRHQGATTTSSTPTRCCETKLLAGQTGYDIVVPSANFLARQIKAGVFQKLDKSLLPNLKNVDPEIAKLLRSARSGQCSTQSITSGAPRGSATTSTRSRRRMPDAPVDSFAHVLRPERGLDSSRTAA